MRIVFEMAQGCQAALAADPENPELLHRLGRLMGQLGQQDLELALVGQAIARAPAVPSYHADLGDALLRAGHAGDARAAFEHTLSIDPGSATAAAGLADGLLDEGNVDAARALVEAGIGACSRRDRVLGRMAILDGHTAEAVELLVDYLAIAPTDATALFYLGVSLQAEELLEPAAAAYRQSIGLDPGLFEAHANLATALTALGRPAEALIIADLAVALDPDRAGAYLNRANALRDLGQLAAARADLVRAVTLAPGYAEAWSTLGNLDHDLGAMTDALDAHDRAVRLAPDLAQARWNRSFTLLATGQLQEGWTEYEWRHHTEAARPEPRDFQWPPWQGEPLAGKRVLVWREQGIGDELLFLTCLIDLVAAAAEVTVLVSPRLVSLVARAFPDVRVVADDGGMRLAGPFEFQSGMASLPRWVRRRRSAFPATGAFLKADAAQTARWRQRLDQLRPGRRFGVCWRSGLMTLERHRHYPPLEALRPLFDLPGIVWINLQYDECREELAGVEREFGVRIHRWDDEDLKNDFESVAGLISALDGVVTAPTAVSSMAGALGCPAWQVDSGSDWTVFGEPRSPWFPSIRVAARAATDEDWGRVVATVRAELAG